MRTYLVAFVAVALCTGASRADRILLRNKEPILTFTSEKSVDEFVRCVNPKLFTLQPSMQTVYDGDATILLVTSFANPFVAVEVSPAETGSSVIYRQRFKSPEFSYRKFQEAVESCR